MLVSVLIIAFVRRSPVIQHIIHLAVPPDDLYEPVGAGSLRCDIIGFSGEFTFNPKFTELYEVGLRPRNGTLPVTLGYRGEMKIEVFNGKQLLLTEHVTSFIAGRYSKEHLDEYADVSLCELKRLPKTDKLAIPRCVVTIVRADPRFATYGDDIEMFIRVVSRP